MNIKLIGLSLTFGVITGLFSMIPMVRAGDQVVEGSAAPGSAGFVDGPTVIEGSDGVGEVGSGDYSRVQDRGDDGGGSSRTSDIPFGASTFAEAPISGATTSDFSIDSSGALSAEQIATNVPQQVLALNPVSIQLRNRSLQITPGTSETTIAVIDRSATTTETFTGAPAEVSQQVGTVTALLAADAKPEATQAGSSIAAVGAPASRVVNLILGYQQLGGSFLTASGPAYLVQAQAPVLVASAVLPQGVLNDSLNSNDLVAQRSQRRVDAQQLNAVIAAYNQVIADCPAEALPELASNPDFQAIGNELRQLKASL